MHIVLVIIIVVLAIGIIAMGVIYFSKIDKLINRSETKPKNITGDKEQLSGIFSSIEDGLILIDDKGTISWSFVSPIGVNPGADRILSALENLPNRNGKSE